MAKGGGRVRGMWCGVGVCWLWCGVVGRDYVILYGCMLPDGSGKSGRAYGPQDVDS